MLSNEHQFENSSSVINAQGAIALQEQPQNSVGNRRTTTTETNIEHSLREQSSRQTKLDNYTTVFHPDGTIVSLTDHQQHQDNAESTTNTVYSRQMFQQLRLPFTSSNQNANQTQTNNNLVNTTGFNSHALSLQQSYQYTEQESLDFNALGEVILDDGRKIRFNFNQGYERDYLKQESAQLTHQAVTFIDPLVITYDTNAIDVLGNEHFTFDMNNDGQIEQLTFTAAGSGFLVLDKNADGEINHGGEVFGGVSGNGFEELTQYDTDNNQWIDENDAIFTELQIWTKTSTNEKQLISLKDAGIGAIYLNSSTGEYTFTNHHNNAKGKLQQSGIFLKENGEVGSIKQIDLAVQELPVVEIENNIATQAPLLVANQDSPALFNVSFLANPIEPNAINGITEEDLTIDWFSFEDELKALNKLIDRLATGEANLLDIGLFLNSGITNQVNTSSFNNPNLMPSTAIFATKSLPVTAYQPPKISLDIGSSKYIDIFNLQSNLGSILNKNI